MRPLRLAARLLALVVPCANFELGHAHETVLVSRSATHHATGANGTSYSRGISADGRYVFFYTYATNLIMPDTNGTISDVVRYDRETTFLARANVSSSGVQSNANSKVSFGCASADGRYVTFWSSSINLVPGVMTGFSNVYVHDFETGVTERINNLDGEPCNNESEFPSLSGDGRFVAFRSLATDLVPGDTNGKGDIFVHDRELGTTVRVSVDSSGAQGNGECYLSSLSMDGRLVAFDSYADNLVPNDSNGTRDVFLHDMQTGATTRISVSSTGVPANGESGSSTISADGRFVGFTSLASSLVPGDTNEVTDAFVHTIATGETVRASVWSDGAQAGGISNDTRGLSSDGRFVPITSQGSLAPPSPYGGQNVVLHDCVTGGTTVVNLTQEGLPAGQGGDAIVSADGRRVAFISNSTHLIPNYQGDASGYYQVYLTDLENWDSSPFCLGTAANCPCGNGGSAGHGCDNSVASGGALLTSGGFSKLAADTLVLSVSDELSSSLTIFLQGSEVVAPVPFGDGVRCAGGTLSRLYVKAASGGAVSAPTGSDSSVSVRSAALGDTIPLGATRAYQTYYRDPDLSFCASPFGNAWNASNGILAVWGP